METLVKTTYPSDKRYWDGDKLFPYLGDCDIVISFSIRNIGKTYACFKNLRKQIALGKTVAVSRYDRIELGVSIEDFLRYYDTVDDEGNCIHGYKRIQPKIKEMPIQIYEFPNGARVYFFAVKDSPNLKGLEIENLTRWFIDEIVPINYKFQTRKYKEFELFGELYHTVLRKNTNLKLLMSANCKTWMNPYCMGWKIPVFKSGNIMKIERNVVIDGKQVVKRIAIENVEPSKAMRDAFIEGEVLLGKDKEQIEAELKAYNTDPDCFIELSDNAQDTGIQIKIKQKIYGLYVKRGKNYIKAEKLDMGKDRYLLTPIEYDENFIYEPLFVKTVEKMLNINRLRFDSRETEFNIRLGVWLSHTKVV